LFYAAILAAGAVQLLVTGNSSTKADARIAVSIRNFNRLCQIEPMSLKSGKGARFDQSGVIPDSVRQAYKKLRALSFEQEEL
jgi:hypothetical protein